jgi:magnesium-transporting ATPase (P-type)
MKIKVGDIIKVSHSERVPADMILVHSTDKSGGVFIKTD